MVLRRSPSRAFQGDDASDNFKGLRDALGYIAKVKGQWAGIPMPLDGSQLIVEPNFPNAEKLAAMGAKLADPAEDEYKDAKIRNRWWSMELQSDIIIFEYNGKIDWGKRPGIHHLNHSLKTLWCADVWGMEQELNAMALLESLLSPRMYRIYFMTGQFLETSKRSGVTYIFRRLKPTVAIKAGRNDQMRILACLCAHPIAYYADSWAGAMTPTDDVVAHLMMMRGDEKLFWKRCNQHPPYRPEAGI